LPQRGIAAGELYKPTVPVSAWLSRCTTAGADGFPAGSLATLDPIPLLVLCERLIGIPLYMLLNVLPFAVPLLLLTGLFKLALLYYILPLFLLGLGFWAVFYSKGIATGEGKGHRAQQYLYTERNSTRYVSLKMVWPASLHFPTHEGKQLIFCAIPHGLAPLGIVGYAIWSKLFTDRLCRWTAAPVVLKIPLVGTLMKYCGYVPAATKEIEKVLDRGDESVGVVLDGIEGMFMSSRKQEVGCVMRRKGIVKIALRKGAPLVPAYCFGHTELWTVVTDPLGILQAISVKLNVSFTPFFGRFGWPLGPPYRKPVLVACGEPIMCPQTDEPSAELINEYHAKLMAGYMQVFEQHKAAYGWGDRTLKLV